MFFLLSLDIICIHIGINAVVMSNRHRYFGMHVNINNRYNYYLDVASCFMYSNKVILVAGYNNDTQNQPLYPIPSPPTDKKN